MTKNFKISFLLLATIVGSFLLFTAQSKAADYSFSSNSQFGSFNIDDSQSNYLLNNGNIYAPDNFPSARVISNPVIYTSYNIGSAKVDVQNSFPNGGQIIYFLSNDNGITWAVAQPGSFVNFSSFGKTLRWSAVIARQNSDSPSPFISSITIIARESDPALSASNDSKRTSDLSAVSNALSDFYKDYGVYPHVDGTDAQSRWAELMTLLLRNRAGGTQPYPYLYSALHDPAKGSNGSSYDYKDISPNEYVLAATLEISNNSNSGNRIIGTFGGINCNNQTYCIGILRNYSYSSSGSILGSSIFSSGNGTTTSTVTNSTTTSVGKSQGLDLNNIVANSLNNLLGANIFQFGDYAAVSTYGETNTTATITGTATNSTQTTTKKNAGTLPLSQPNAKVAGASISISKASGVPTGTTDSLAISLLLSAVATLFYFAYTKTWFYKKRDISAVIEKSRLDKDKFNFV